MSKDWYKEVQKRQLVLEAAHQQLHDVTLELVRSTEAVERLAEFASEMASDREAFNEGMKANCKTAMEFLNQLEEEQLHASYAEQNDVEMWRGLCHARAVQLNEAYDTIAKLRTQLEDERRQVEYLRYALVRNK